MAAIDGPEPTGSPMLDSILVAGAVAACTWSAASAPWWMGVVAAAVAASLAPAVWLVLVALVALSSGLVIGLVGRTMPWSRALVAGLTIQVLARLGDVWFFGATAVIGVVVAVNLGWWGLRRRPRRDRRRAWIALACAGGACVVAIVGAVLGAAAAKADLQEGNRSARAGIDLLADGDLDGAGAAFASAASAFGRAEGDLSKPWVQLGRAVPVVAQHRNAAYTLSKAAADASESLSAALVAMDVDSLRMVDGRVDVASIEQFAVPMNELTSALAGLDAAVHRADDRWLVARLRRELHDLSDEVGAQRLRGEDALRNLAVAPAMLGADESRVYFVAFTTPSEARGLGGFMGNWAEITVTGGRVTMTDFGRTVELNRGGRSAKQLTGPDGYLERYGRFLLSGGKGEVAKSEVWSDLTVSPHFPSVAQAIAELYPQSGGEELDGVVALDVYVVARLLEITGPIRVEGVDVELSAANVADFLLRDQYLLGDNEGRIDLLAEVAKRTVEQLLTSTLPAPRELTDLLGPMVEQGRLDAWAVRVDEQAMFDRLGMSGALPDLEGGDGLGFTVNNVGNNKIDAYLDATVGYAVDTDPATGEVSSTLTLEFTNAAPRSGLPDSVIGNTRGLPAGTNFMYLSIFTTLPFVDAELDGKPVGFANSTEEGFVVSSTYLQIDASSTSTLVVELAGRLDLAAGYRLAVRSPPMARPAAISVSVNGAPPAEIVESGVSWVRVGSVSD